ncbi:MAG: tyrosine-type recombinase/integrase [Chloroflexota bacterium]
MNALVPVSIDDDGARGLIPAQAATDAQLIALWLHGRPVTTQRIYRREAASFFALVRKPLQLVALADLHAFDDSRSHLAPATRALSVSAIRSLMGFALRIGYLRFNVSQVIRVTSVKDTLAERILPEGDVQAMIFLETDPRNRILLRLVYAAGLRVSEACGLRWRDVQARGDAGQVTIFGKGDKTRHVLLSSATWHELARWRNGASLDDWVFPSRRGSGPLNSATVWRIVRKAAERAGVLLPVSPHWLRHAHASHALDRGAPVHLVQQTLGHATVATTGRYLHARPNDSSARYLSV